MRENSKRLLCEIGSKVKIDLNKISEKLPPKIIESIQSSPIGTVIDYKMTDATDIGVIVKLENKDIYWFFEKEVNKLTENGEIIPYQNNFNIGTYESSNYLNKLTNLSGKFDIKTIRTNSKIGYLVKPGSFLDWLIYSVKDVI